MPMRKDLRRTGSNQVLLNSRAKTEENAIPSEPKCFGCQGFGHMKQEYPTYLKSVRKSKALAATLNDTEPEIESNDSDDEGILSSFTTTVDPIEGIVEVVDEKEDLVESKFEKMDD